MKKVLLVMMSTLLVLMLAVGCTSKPKADAAESAKILYDLYIKGDIKDASKLGMKEDEAKEALDVMKKTFVTTFSTNLKATGLIIAEEQIVQIVEARIEGIKILDGTTEIVSENKDSAEVKLSTTYFNELDLQDKVAEAVLAEVEAAGLTDEQEILDKMTELFVNKLIEAYKNIEPSADQKSDTFKFIKQKNVWVAEDMSNFGMRIGQITNGQ